MTETKKTSAGKDSPAKQKIVQEFKDLFKKYSIVAALDMELLPTRQLQKMRTTLRKNNCVIKMTKRRVMKIAIDGIKNDVKGVEAIIPHLKGMPALLFTNENPFRLYKMIEKSKSNAPAKAGQKAPKDIVVKSGVTSFAPGPIIGELGQVGIKAGIENGKVAIKTDSVVVKEGDVIKANVASILLRLGIEPMEIGLTITAVLEKGLIYGKDVLAIDETQFMNNIMLAGSSAMNLAVEISYPCKDTIEILLQNSFRDSKAVALEANFMADAVVGDLLAKAEAQASSLKAEAKQ